MQEGPHTHQPKLYKERTKGPWILFYGDTHTRVCRRGRQPSAKDVKRALAVAVRRHDKGTIKAGEAERELAAVRKLLELNVPAGKWASEVLDGNG